MSFTAPVFFLFLPVTLLLYWLLPPKRRWLLLLAASFLFYAWFNVWLLALVVTTILVAYLCARLTESAETPKGKKKAVAFSTAVCLGILAVFKYLDFAVGCVFSLANLLGADVSFSGFHILLPMGISFYVFQTMSYTFDVYRGRVPAEKHLGYYALFVVFFPQLVAGPIERPGDLLPQLKQPHSFQAEDFAEGGRLLLKGYAKKMLIADFLAGFVDSAYGNVNGVGGAALATATVLFAFQIYCDFSGYSDIAQGCARLMGIRLSDNFRRPYAAGSVREFWRRWHISLTGWFRDYLYIPLGGSRKGRFRTCLNIMITFLVSGLWHGANWTFVLWGGLHGVYLAAERLILKKKEPGKAITFLLVCLAWVFFRSAGVQEAFAVFARIFTAFRPGSLLADLAMTRLELVITALLLILLPFVERLPRISGENRNLGAAVTLWYFGILAIVLCRFLVLSRHGETAFLYFQF